MISRLLLGLILSFAPIFGAAEVTSSELKVLAEKIGPSTVRIIDVKSSLDEPLIISDNFITPLGIHIPSVQQSLRVAKHDERVKERRDRFFASKAQEVADKLCKELFGESALSKSPTYRTSKVPNLAEGAASVLYLENDQTQSIILGKETEYYFTTKTLPAGRIVVVLTGSLCWW